MSKKIYAFDLDDTLCERNTNYEHLGVDKYRFSRPIPEMINKVNELYDKGHTIYIYTARGMSQFNGDVNKIISNLYVLTLNSLDEWGIKHHGLIMGKIHYDFLIDDKSIGKDSFDKFINEH
jgi:hydroxymethylpyrimidine pyrophosphatase-like HAD family hydrolase